jgi:hypothetical protein
MRKRRIPGSRTAVCGFLRDTISLIKKTLHAAEQQWRHVVRARRRWRREQFMFDPARFQDGEAERPLPPSITLVLGPAL